MTFRYFGGIDFSGAKEPLDNLWTAVGEERDGRLCIVSVCPHPFRADLAAFVTEGWRRHARADDAPILWGADFPFGLPTEAVATIEGLRERSWRGVASWCADRPPDEVRDGLTAFGKAGRRTDTGGALAPLDLRLYRQTVEGLRLLWEMRDGGEEVSILPVSPRAGAPTTIVEVYPSGAVRDLGIKGSRVPSRPGEVRARPAALRPYLSFDHPSLEAIACTLEDARDACLACLVAYQCRDDLDQPARVGAVPAETVALEGWIYRPPAAVGGAAQGS